MRYFILLLCVCTSCFVNAQHKLTYTGSVEGGLLIGSKPTNTFVFTTQGVAYRQYTFGIGSGLDYYPFRSVPLFADVKRTFGDKSVRPFVQAAAGINFTSAHSRDAKYFYQNTNGNFNNGFFAKGGGGLMFRAQKRLRLSLSGGYSYKTATFNYEPLNGDPWFGQIVPLKDVYKFNRWYIGAGIVW